MFPELQVEGLLLKEIHPDDIIHIHKGLSDPAVIKYYGVSFLTLEETKTQMTWYQNLQQTGTGIWWKIMDKENNFLGACGFNDMTSEKAEIGYWLLPQFWGKGIAKRAVTAILNFSRDTLHLKRVEAFLDSENKASKIILEKCGFKWIRSQENAAVKDGRNITLELWIKLN
ncbi:ribosomal-protein-alanine N-acetyltransferase [Pustulibacterium marinum]|uniref:Ribosomal-protein-alanine N-acetyltransferase n=1 Tax=Pustulibacterium marinum TaxID=1224947 RepID=A0A1I7IQ96_9FLAO|nr:GNAT family N-acetyltransferase [Pustulibacterium marinum]SFU75067.1 ribosomal-protein-alanine N-acetyltransferase [Pustulibacterium marinum]